jgi:hypothetical protein
MLLTAVGVASALDSRSVLHAERNQSHLGFLIGGETDRVASKTR